MGFWYWLGKAILNKISSYMFIIALPVIIGLIITACLFFIYMEIQLWMMIPYFIGLILTMFVALYDAYLFDKDEEKPCS